MAKTITFTFEGIDYTLEFSRKTIAQMEAAGFVASEIDNKPMTLLPQLFAGAFKMHHRHTKQDVIDRIYAAMPNKGDLIDALAEMYYEPIASLMDEPDESAVGNVEWVANK